jgi:hypothetical protein
MIRRKLTASFVTALVLVGLASAQQVIVNPQLPLVPALACNTIQLQGEDGTPVALAPVHLKVLEIKMMKGNVAGAAVTFKLVKKLKTDASGKLLLPELKSDTYALELPDVKKHTAGEFLVEEGKKPGSCTATFALKDKGNTVAIELAASAEAADKK